MRHLTFSALFLLLAGALPALAQVPTVSDVRRDIGYPPAGVPITVSFVAKPGTYPIDESSILLCYSVDGGPVDCVMGSRTNDSTFSAMIPGQGDSVLVTYWITLSDTDGGATMSPGDTARFKYFYRVTGNQSIQLLQHTPNLLGTSGYLGFTATVTGVVTADTADIPGDPDGAGGADPLVVIQNGPGAWSGIAVRARNSSGDIIPAVASLRRGDSVTITGEVAEVGEMTVLADAGIVGSHGQATVPSPYILTTADINMKRDGETQDAEMWESVLICYGNVVVAQRNADDPGNAGEFYTANASTLSDQNTWTRVETDNSRTGYTTRTPDQGETQLQDGMPFEALIGILAYTTSQYKLIPRSFADYVITSNGVARTPIAGATARLLPNVTSGPATLELTLDRPTTVTLFILDARGNRVAEPVLHRAVASGTTRLVLDAGSLAVGRYNIVVQSSGGRLVTPLTVVR